MHRGPLGRLGAWVARGLLDDLVSLLFSQATGSTWTWLHKSLRSSTCMNWVALSLCSSMLLGGCLLIFSAKGQDFRAVVHGYLLIQVFYFLRTLNQSMELLSDSTFPCWTLTRASVLRLSDGKWWTLCWTFLQHCEAVNVVQWELEEPLASLIKKDEKTLHQMGSLTMYKVIWFVKTHKWWFEFVVPSYFSKLGIFHHSGKGVSRKWDVNENILLMLIVAPDVLKPLLALVLFWMVWVGSSRVRSFDSIHEGQGGSSLPRVNSKNGCLNDPWEG